MIVHTTQTKCQTKRDNKGWKFVLRNDGTHQSFKLVLRNGSEIDTVSCEMIPNMNVPESFQSFVDHVSSKHTNVRKHDHEYGTMAAVGERKEIRTAGLSIYRPACNNNKENRSKSNRLHRYAAFDFHKLILNTSLKTQYMEDIEVPVSNSTSWKVRDL